jgi:hypothetical protein
MFKNLMVKNIATADEWRRFKTVLASQGLTVSDFFREIVKGAIDDNEN